MTLEVEVGHFTSAGPKAVNEDFAGCLMPTSGEQSRGLVAAVADGVSTCGGGLEAAQTTVMSLLLDYQAAPETWDTTVVLDRLINAQTRWLDDHNRRRRDNSPVLAALTTLTALVLRGHGFTLAHVGDTRAYLLRAGECAQLTEDHRFDHPDLAHRLTRAVGLDDQVRIDYLQAEVHVGDAFVLVTDGVHGHLKPARFAALAAQGSAQEATEALVSAALAAGGKDNATALVLRVKGLADSQLDDASIQRRELPVPPKLTVGDKLDSFTITSLVADNGVHRLYQARDVDGDLVAAKTLHNSRANDPQERAMLAHEAWLALRVAGRSEGRLDGEGFVQLREISDPQAFYFVYDWHSGRTLEQLMGRPPRARTKERDVFGNKAPIADVIACGVAVGRALGRLHRLGVVHRDIKPGNLHLGDDGVWRVLDLGVAISGREPRALRTLHAGTPSYMNPEQWASADNDSGESADARSDLYALGATLYEWLTGKLPYGVVEPYQRGRFRRDPKPPSQFRPDVPIWLDHVLLKAVARDARQRFSTAEELVLALERGASRPLPAPGNTPLIRRDPAALWKVAVAVLVLFNLLLVYWLLFLPR
ncbi:bifunctional protein-serine/threonine kinase/phosphatase [soil metagenome]